MYLRYFVFATNNAHLIDQGLRNRCDEFRMDLPTPEDWFERAKLIAETENIPLSDDQLRDLLATTKCDARDVMLTLEYAKQQLG